MGGGWQHFFLSFPATLSAFSAKLAKNSSITLSEKPRISYCSSFVCFCVCRILGLKTKSLPIVQDLTSINKGNFSQCIFAIFVCGWVIISVKSNSPSVFLPVRNITFELLKQWNFILNMQIHFYYI